MEFSKLLGPEDNGPGKVENEEDNDRGGSNLRIAQNGEIWHDHIQLVLVGTRRRTWKERISTQKYRLRM